MSLAGYRWWHAGVRPGEGWRLRSLWWHPPRPHWWDGPHLAAPRPPCVQCPPATCSGADRRCRCGIYAFRSEQRAWGEAPAPSQWHSLWGDYTVLGEVALWGKVVEHEHGYRAEHAMVQRLLVPTRLVIHVSVATFHCFGQLGDDEEGISLETMEHTAAPGMAEGLARRYDVEVEFRPPVTCKVFA